MLDDKYVKTQLRRNLSPLRYPGGKRTFAPFLSSIILRNGLEGCDYLEPYAGGAGAALELLRSGVVSSLHINDKDPAIYWFWKAALSESQRFLDCIHSVELTVEEWRRQKEILQGRKAGFELGFAAFYLNRTCVSGVIKRCGGPIGGYDQTGNYKIGCRFHRDTLGAKIEFLRNNRDRIKVSRKDAIEFLVNAKPSETHSFTYLDPPYYHKASELYLNSYTHKDHEELRDFLLGDYANRFWVLSYDLCPEIMDLYNQHQHRTIGAHHALANKGTKCEFITASDRTHF